MQQPNKRKLQIVSHLRGNARWIQQIEAAIPREWLDTDALPPSHRWFGAFSGTGVPLQVIALCSDGDALVFDVQSGGRLLRPSENALLDVPF